MNQVYRGYPLEHAEMLEMQNAQKPYMIYNREEQSVQRGSWEDRRRVQAEYEYFRGLYPLAVRSWQRFVEEEMDRSDVPGSMMYDEYPDRENLYLMRDRIINNAGEQGRIEEQDMVLILMLHEMLRRRQTKQ